jgi:hypothetical protein
MKKLLGIILILLWAGMASAGPIVMQGFPPASATVAGVVELATDAETIAGSATGVATTPANIAAKFTYTLGVGTALGSADAITVDYTPNLTLSDGVIAIFRASAANATTTPTFAPDGLTAHTIVKQGGAALAAGDIPGANAEVILRYNLANTRWELLNPSATTIPGDTSIGSATAGKNLTVNATLGAELVTWTDVGWNEDGATWTFAASTLTHITGNTTTVTATLGAGITAGTTYKVVIAGTGGGGTATYTLGGTTGTTIAASGAIAITDYITAGTTGSFIITPASGCTVAITSVSIKALTDATGDVTFEGNIRARSQVLGAISPLAYPPYSFADDPDTGMYRSASNSVGFSGGGSTLATFNTSGLTITGGLINLTANAFIVKDADQTIALRNTTNQQTFRVYNTYTDASNGEWLSLTGVHGASVNINAMTNGTGADNLNINLRPAGTGGVMVQDQTANVGGGHGKFFKNAVSATLSGTSGSIDVNVPSGTRIVGVQLRVDTAITSGDGATSWTAAYVNTPTTAICSGQAFATSTKFNAIHPAYELTTGVVTIRITPNANTFSGGVVRAVVYYEDFVALSDAP